MKDMQCFEQSCPRESLHLACICEPRVHSPKTSLLRNRPFCFLSTYGWRNWCESHLIREAQVCVCSRNCVWVCDFVCHVQVHCPLLWPGSKIETMANLSTLATPNPTASGLAGEYLRCGWQEKEECHLANSPENSSGFLFKFAWKMFELKNGGGFWWIFFWSPFPMKGSTKTKLRGTFGAKSGAKFGTKIRTIRGTFVLQLFWPKEWTISNLDFTTAKTYSENDSKHHVCNWYETFQLNKSKNYFCMQFTHVILRIQTKTCNVIVWRLVPETYFYVTEL